MTETSPRKAACSFFRRYGRDRPADGAGDVWLEEDRSRRMIGSGGEEESARWRVGGSLVDGCVGRELESLVGCGLGVRFYLCG